MARFFTSDWHLGSTNILRYANRPFENAGKAASALVDNCNEVASQKTDVVFHVGDFWLHNVDRHDEIEDINTLPAYMEDYLNFINGRFILISGNHDDGRNCESDLKNMVVDLNQNYRNIYVSHYPSDHKFYRGPINNVALCGHVHDKWILKFDSTRMVLNVNVGVDVWNYRPVRDAEIIELLDYFRATMWTKINPAPGKWTNFTLTRKALDEFKIAHSEEVKKAREQRKQEKHAKKGLTPEECERRRVEAMKAKGIDPNRKHETSRKEEPKFSYEDAVQFGFIPPETEDVLFDSWNDV